jgi:hypothetical protein
MTAYDVDAARARAIARFCVGHYQKPVRPRDMVNFATAVLKLPGNPSPTGKRPQTPRPPGGHV